MVNGLLYNNLKVLTNFLIFLIFVLNFFNLYLGPYEISFLISYLLGLGLLFLINYDFSCVPILYEGATSFVRLNEGSYVSGEGLPFLYSKIVIPFSLTPYYIK